MQLSLLWAPYLAPSLLPGSAPAASYSWPGEALWAQVGPVPRASSVSGAAA